MDVSAISFEQTGLDYFEKSATTAGNRRRTRHLYGSGPAYRRIFPFAILLDLKKQLSASLLRFLSHYLPAIPSLCE